MPIKIKIEEMNFYYDKNQALKNINIKIPEKSTTALIGPSGCGKSTFIRTINRMNDLIIGARVEGKILIDGEDVIEKNKDIFELRKKIGMVFQRPNPFPKSIYENVIYGPKHFGVKNKKVLGEIAEVSLRKAFLWEEVKNQLNKPAFSLSGGQQQRLCIARCLAVEPEVLLMDEPTSALDPIATLKIEELINHLKKDFTVVIVTHSMQQAARISDHTAFFLNGEIIEFGETCELFEKPKDKRTEDYITGRFG